MNFEGKNTIEQRDNKHGFKSFRWVSSCQVTNTNQMLNNTG